MAPEQEVIDRYDIDDYKNKAELKAQKLYTTMRVALKSYRDLKTLDTNRKGLTSILDAAPKLSHPQSITHFFNGVLTQIIGLCNLGESSLISTINNSLLVTADGDQIKIQAGTGQFANSYQNPEVEKIIKTYSERMLQLQSNEWLPSGALLMPLKVHNQPIGFIYLEDAQYLNEANQKLIYIMVHQCTSALENLQLYLDLKEANQETSRMLTLAEQARDMAEAANQAKSQFLANMSHELRTPLNSLLILAQLLANNKEGNLTEQQMESALTMHSASSELLTLINEILDLSKVEAGKMEIHVEALSLLKLMETIQHKFQPVAEKQTIAFNLTMDEDLPKVLHTDAQRLQQIINNLLSNAFKFTEPQGQVRLDIMRPSNHPQLLQSPLIVESQVIIRVTDTGIGIPKDKQSVIFEAFQQADGTTSRRFGGTGLGLSISRQLAHLLEGEILVSSEEGKGSTFTLYLPETLSNSTMPSNSQPIAIKPLKEGPVEEFQLLKNTFDSERKPDDNSVQTQLVTDDSCSEENIVDDKETLQPGDKSLLIVENDRKLSSVLIAFAREQRFKCLMAEDGNTGLQLAASYKPDAIVLDLDLPQTQSNKAWGVLERLKDNSETRHIPVLFVSASDHSMEAKKMGAIGSLLKPVDRAEFVKAFKNIERFVDKSTKNLLIFLEPEPHQQDILELINSAQVKSTFATIPTVAVQYLKNTLFDGLILDSNSEAGTAVKFLEQLSDEQTLIQTPIIFYAKRELTVSEENIIRQCERRFIIKLVKSPERLLDEVSLFLHLRVADLPRFQQHLLRMVHDKTTLFMGKKVLLIDDDVHNSFALSGILEDKNMVVIAGYDGNEVRTLLDKHPDIDIVLMDIMMPEMDGYEVIQQIRKRFRKLPILVLTAKSRTDGKVKCLEVGANDYITKPIDTEQLLSRMRIWLYQ